LTITNHISYVAGALVLEKSADLPLTERKRSSSFIPNPI